MDKNKEKLIITINIGIGFLQHTISNYIEENIKNIINATTFAQAETILQEIETIIKIREMEPLLEDVKNNFYAIFEEELNQPTNDMQDIVEVSPDDSSNVSLDFDGNLQTK